MSEEKVPYRTRSTKCAECGMPLTDNASFDVCAECSHRILAGLPVHDPMRLTCATCWYEFDVVNAPCPRCRLFDACQAIVDQGNHGPFAIIDSSLIRNMATALDTVKISVRSVKA